MTSSGVPLSVISRSSADGTRHMGEGGLLVHVERRQILRPRESGPQRVLSTMTSEIFIGSPQRARLGDFGVERLIDVVTASSGDHRQRHGGNDGHRVAPGVGGGGPNDFQPLRLVLWPVRKAGEIAIAIAARSTQHARAVGSDPDLGPLTAIGRQIK